MNNNLKISQDTSVLSKVLKKVKSEYIINHTIDSLVFCVDKNQELFIMEIQDPKLLSTTPLKSILSKIIKEKVEEIEKDNDTSIIEIIYFMAMNVDSETKENIELDGKSELTNAFSKFIMYLESSFFINLDIYDVITGVSDDKTYMVMSENPINTFRYSKLDIDDNLNTKLKNFL